MTSKYDAVLWTITGTCRTYNKGYFYLSQHPIIYQVKELAIHKLHWACRILGISAVPKVAQHNSFRESKISKYVPPDVHKVWKTSEKGRASPIQRQFG